MTLEDKLNKLYPFERMHALYGARENVAPPTTGKFGIGEDVRLFDQQDPTKVYLFNLDTIPPPPRTPTKILPSNCLFEGFSFVVQFCI